MTGLGSNRALSLYGNQFNGTIPTGISAMTSLTYVQLAALLITGRAVNTLLLTGAPPGFVCAACCD